MKLSEITKFVQQCEARMNNLNRELIDERAKEQKLKKDYEVVLAKSSHYVGYYLGIVFLLVGLIGTPMFLMNYLDGRQNEGFMLFLENIAFFTFIPGGFVGYYIGCFFGLILNAILDAPYKKRANEYYSIKASIDKSIAELDKKLEEEKLLYKELKEEQDYARIYDIEINNAEDLAKKYIVLKTKCDRSQYAKDEIKDTYNMMKKLPASDKNVAFEYMFEWKDRSSENKYDFSEIMFELLTLSANEGCEKAQENIASIMEQVKNCIEEERESEYYCKWYLDECIGYLEMLSKFEVENAKKLLDEAEAIRKLKGAKVKPTSYGGVSGNLGGSLGGTTTGGTTSQSGHTGPGIMGSFCGMSRG